MSGGTAPYANGAGIRSIEQIQLRIVHEVSSVNVAGAGLQEMRSVPARNRAAALNDSEHGASNANVSNPVP